MQGNASDMMGGGRETMMLRIHSPSQLLALLEVKMNHQLRIITPVYCNNVRVCNGKWDLPSPYHFKKLFGFVA